MANESLLMLFFLKGIIIRIYKENYKFPFGTIANWSWLVVLNIYCHPMERCPNDTSIQVHSTGSCPEVLSKCQYGSYGPAGMVSSRPWGREEPYLKHTSSINPKQIATARMPSKVTGKIACEWPTWHQAASDHFTETLQDKVKLSLPGHGEIVSWESESGRKQTINQPTNKTQNKTALEQNLDYLIGALEFSALSSFSRMVREDQGCLEG